MALVVIEPVALVAMVEVKLLFIALVVVTARE
jgi:hypothetical protein